MRALLVLLFLTATAACAPPTPFPSPIEVGTQPPDYLVRIFKADEEGNRGAGTGTLISPDIIVTASHVVDGKIGAEVEVLFFTDWSVVTGKVLDLSANDGYEEDAVGHDVAVIKLDKPRKETLCEVAEKAVKGKVTIEGFAHGPYLSAEGVYYTHDTSERWGVIRGAQARNGDSGGPVLQNGKLVGVLWGASDGYTWFTTIEKIIELFPELVKPTKDPKTNDKAKPRFTPRIKYSLR